MSKKITIKEISYLLPNGMILDISTKRFKRKYKNGWKEVTDTTGVIKGLENEGYFWLERDGDYTPISGSFNSSVIEEIFDKYYTEIEKHFLEFYKESLDEEV